MTALDALLAALAEVPADQLPEAIGALEAAKARAWARLTTPAVPGAEPHGSSDGAALDVAEVSRRTGMSVPCSTARPAPGTCHSPGASDGGWCSTRPGYNAGLTVDEHGDSVLDFVPAQSITVVYACTKEARAAPRDSRPRGTGRVPESEGARGHRPRGEAGRRERVRMGAGRRACGADRPHREDEG